MRIHDYIKKGFPEHVIADAIIYLWIYMAGPKDERIPKQKLFSARFKIYNFDEQGISLFNILQNNPNRTLIWAADILLDFLPRDMQEKYLDEYISFTVSSGKLWINELYILQTIAAILDVKGGILKSKIEKVSDKRLSQLVSKQPPPGALLTSEDLKNSINQLRNKLNLSEQKFIQADSIQQKPTLTATEKTTFRRKKNTRTDKKESAIKKRGRKSGRSAPKLKTDKKVKPYKTSENSVEPENTDKYKVWGVLYIIVIVGIIYFSTSPNGSQSTNSTHQTEQNENINSTDTEDDQLNNEVNEAPAEFKYLHDNVFNEDGFIAYSKEGKKNKFIPARSVYRVVNESEETITFQTKDGLYYSDKSIFRLYKDVPFNKKFNGEELIATENADLRYNLSFGSESEWYYEEGSVVTYVKETPTSVQINTTEGLLWADKEKFTDFNSRNERVGNSSTGNETQNNKNNSNFNRYGSNVDWIYKFVTLASDAKVRGTPNIFAETEFTLEKGKRVLVVVKVPDSMFYEVSISGETYFIPDISIRF